MLKVSDSISYESSIRIDPKDSVKKFPAQDDGGESTEPENVGGNTMYFDQVSTGQMSSSDRELKSLS